MIILQRNFVRVLTHPPQVRVASAASTSASEKVKAVKTTPKKTAKAPKKAITSKVPIEEKTQIDSHLKKDSERVNVNPAKIPKLTLTELNKLTVPNLRIKLEELGLDTKGRRIFFLTYAEAPLFLEIFFLKPQLEL